ncbi:MAG: T9SS type A sorting domain-containing protein [Rhodothermia bacterium]|nr:T9SS type A sorting domain-containing protein [Rhodothermia bacterium]
MSRPLRVICLLLAAVAVALIPSTAVAQDGGGSTPIVSESAGPVCVLPVEPVDRNLRLVPDPMVAKSAAASTISVTYIDDDGLDPWPQAAKDAFGFAKGIWEQTVTSSVTIDVEAHWADLGGCTGGSIGLGSAGANRRWRGGPPLAADTWYVDALADALIGSDVCGLVNPSCTGDPDIVANFNKACDDPGSSVTWYFGTDGNTPSGQTDFVSVVLHELGHGLGFSGAGNVSAGSGTIRTGGPADPTIYDRSTEDGMGNNLVSMFTDPSVGLAAALEGDSSGVFFNATNANAANGGSPATLYSPSTWEGGSSYSHLNESTYNGGTQALMTPALASMEAVHVVGSITCGMFQDMGWTIAAANCDVALPVELASFTAFVAGGDVLLRWQTLSESSNAGFDVQTYTDRGSFESVGFVPGSGSSTGRQAYEFRVSNASPGANRFRLAQRDLDGSVQILGEVDVFVELANTFELTAAYPNPFNPQTTFYLTARETQQARVEVFDSAGRLAAVLFDGMLEESSRQRITVDGAGWPSGVYFYRVTGEYFTASDKLVLLK